MPHKIGLWEFERDPECRHTLSDGIHSAADFGVGFQGAFDGDKDAPSGKLAVDPNVRRLHFIDSRARGLDLLEIIDVHGRLANESVHEVGQLL